LFFYVEMGRIGATHHISPINRGRWLFLNNCPSARRNESRELLIAEAGVGGWSREAETCGGFRAAIPEGHLLRLVGIAGRRLVGGLQAMIPRITKSSAV